MYTQYQQWPNLKSKCRFLDFNMTTIENVFNRMPLKKIIKLKVSY